MDDKGLSRCLGGGLTPTDWYRLLNAQVFFWLDSRRLDKLLGALAYRDRRQTVLTLDTACLLSRHEGLSKPGRTCFNPVGYDEVAWTLRQSARRPPGLDDSRREFQ